MEQKITPTEARGGVITGRVFVVLAVSAIGAVAALAIAWYALSPAG